MIDYHTKFQNNSLSSVTVALTSEAQRTDPYMLLIVENKFVQRWHDVHSYFYKNPLTGTTLLTDRKTDMKKRNLSFIVTWAIRLLSSYESHTQLRSCTSLIYTYTLHTYRRHVQETSFPVSAQFLLLGCNTLSSLSSLLTVISGGCIDLIRHNAWHQNNPAWLGDSDK
jgi:hypothetical protein